MGVVSILTHSFTDGYNREFSRVFGGGLERYVLDLCSVIRGLGHIPEVHQLSYFEAFQTRTEQIDVYGYAYDMNDVPEAFARMAAAARGPVIYASCLWQPIAYKPGSLGICHGINWDRPALPLETKQQVAEHIQLALDGLVRIVSVDSHFQTFCRAACTFADPGQVVLIPNAVDTSYFTPAPPRRTFEHEQEEEWLAAWKKDLASHEDHTEAAISGMNAASFVRGRNDGDGMVRADRSEVTIIAKELDSANIRKGLAGRQPNDLTDDYLKEQDEDVSAALQVSPSRPLRILYPRRISMERGIIPMMLAADQLLGAFPDLEVEFAGELVEGSTVGRSFRYWHRTHPHADRIKHRTYDFRDIREAYHQADIAVIPTVFSEGTSYACLEAMSCGLPVVASNVGGLNDLIQDGFNGLLVPPGEEGLTAALVRLVQDRAERERLGIYARETALSYDISHWRRRWSSVLESFLAEAGLKEGIRG
ncbi:MULTISPECIES: glycosyltransferase family 4 protein [Paenibacillus]|uniref:Glycosyl transferase family 1 n=1 Tax=Paenibacillus pabuli TaxID=1472 RepID=A0A855Y323_9BACL|nr:MULTISPECIES: glycosyltransferase family 4 protein [Paenibacillus]PWW33304.1 glycosyl transferase family 1 [Paenibacillus pabuli]PXW08453.1 glycosyl transferase family 1 [Paenibacillus taichungensis]RAI99158.1 glycosyl transferase family 1 [Paenibacillus pabuli]